MKEINKHHRADTNQDQHSLEMFHRAVFEDDQHARSWLQRQYNATVRDWLFHHPRQPEACRHTSEANFVALAFERLWQAPIQNQNLDFGTLDNVLRYLRACLNSAILDTLRDHQRSEEAAMLQLHTPYPDSTVTRGSNSNESRQLWKSVSNMLPTTQEQRLAYLLFHCGLKPGEIVLNCPEEFSDLEEIYSLRYKIFQHLQDNLDQFSDH